MNEMTIDEIALAFPLSPIPDPAKGELTDSFGDDVEKDLAILWGRRWDEIACEAFRLHFEVVCWLTPQGFRYYLPSIIKCSLHELATTGKLVNTELVVDYALGFLLPTNSPILYNRRRDLWRGLTSDQIGVVKDWILNLSMVPDALPGEKLELVEMLDTFAQD